MTDKPLAERTRNRVRAVVRGGWSTWAPWMAALVVFIVAIQTAPSIYDVDAGEGGLLPLVAASAAVPVGLVWSRPLVAWVIASAGALLAWQAFPIVDGDPWKMTVIHGLVILAALLLIVWSPWPRKPIHAGIRIVVWLGTVAVFATLAASDIRVGWVVAVTAVAAAGVVLRLLRVRVRPHVPAANDDLADWKDGFREAFTGTSSSPPTGAPFAERVFGNRPWVMWLRSAGPWILAIGVFAIALADIDDNYEIHSLVLPVTAALVALPVALVRNRVLIGWRIITVVGLAFAVVGTPLRDGYIWPSSLQFVWLGVTFLVSVRHDRPTAVWVWLANLLVMSAGFAGLVDGAEGPTTTVIFGMTVLVFIGDLVRTRRSATRSLEVQTEVSELEKARRAVLEEKTRVARDLHDVVAHHMSMVVVQAESAPYRIPWLNEDAKAEFASISKSARQALGEIRGLLGVLRSENQEAMHVPQPEIDQVSELVDGARLSGVDVAFAVAGAKQPVSRATSQSAYRIVQEALANAARHSAGAAVEVELTYAAHELTVRISNEPPGQDVDPGPIGHGIVGMRERAAAVGGTLQVGPQPDGGFEVVARLPLGLEETSDD